MQRAEPTNLTKVVANSVSSSTHAAGLTTEELNQPVQLVSSENFRGLHTLRVGPARYTFFSRLPKDIFDEIDKIHYDPSRESLIGTLLHHVAYAAKEDIDLIKDMLEANPELLLWASDAVDPAGNTIPRVTPYQFALLAGDDYLAEIIAPYFEKLGERGRVALAAQNAECKRDIDRMQTPDIARDYQFDDILKAIKEASPEAVRAALACQFNESEYPLHAALAQFRQHFVPREITAGMHFNYNDLQAALNVYETEFNNLNNGSCDKYTNKSVLFWRQIIGYIERLLPACDRQAFGQGIYYITQEDETLKRSFNWRCDDGAFPHTVDDSSYSGLGYRAACGRWGGGMGEWAAWQTVRRVELYEYYVNRKNIKLNALVQPYQAQPTMAASAARP